jgi:hypothetical protein
MFTLNKARNGQAGLLALPIDFWTPTAADGRCGLSSLTKQDWIWRDIMSVLGDFDSVSPLHYASRLGFMHPLHHLQKQVLDPDLPIQQGFPKVNFERFKRSIMTSLQVQLSAMTWPGDQVLWTLTNMAVPLFIDTVTICCCVGDPNWKA